MPDISLDFSRTWACGLLFLSAYSIQSWLTFLSSPHYLLIAVDSLNSVLALLLEILSASCCHGSHRYCCGYWCFLLLLPLLYSSSSFWNWDVMWHIWPLTPHSAIFRFSMSLSWLRDPSGPLELTLSWLSDSQILWNWHCHVHNLLTLARKEMVLATFCELDTNYNILGMWNVIRDFPG